MKLRFRWWWVPTIFSVVILIWVGIYPFVTEFYDDGWIFVLAELWLVLWFIIPIWLLSIIIVIIVKTVRRKNFQRSTSKGNNNSEAASFCSMRDNFLNSGTIRIGNKIFHISKWLIALLLFIPGVVVNETRLLSSIHEFFHLAVAWAWGFSARISSPTSVRSSGPSFDILMAGYFGEIILYPIVALALAVLGRRKYFPTGAFPLGYALAAFREGFISVDFNEGLLSMIDQSKTAYLANFKYVQRGVFIWFISVGIIFIGSSLVIVLLSIFTKPTDSATDNATKNIVSTSGTR